MRTKENKKGISLIVLIVTIIVIIILAAVVILTLSKNNPIESAKEARFKDDVRTFQDELALAVSKEYADAGGHRDEKITTSDFDKIKKYIPSFSEKYRDKFIIQDDELRYTKNLGEKEKEYVQSISIKEKVKLLPDEYQQVEYLESTGTQYIDTGIKPTRNTKVQMDFQLVKYKDYRSLFGSVIAANVNSRFYFQTRNNYFMTGFGNNSTDGRMPVDTLRHIVDFNDGNDINNFFIDTVKFTNDINKYNENNLNIYIFAENNSIGVRSYSEFKLYMFKIFENNTLVRNFIPCKSTTSVNNVNGVQVPANTKGLYDTVEGKFYTNQGDPTKGDFIPGPDVD